MRRAFAPLLSLAAVAALSTTACSSSSAADDSLSGNAEAELRVSAFRYTCRASASTVLNRRELAVTVSAERLRFVGEFGESLGERDHAYRAPAGTSRARYTGFEWGEDCSLKFVVDSSAVRGAAAPKLRVQCSGDDGFRQDVYDCASPTRSRLTTPEVEPPPPAQPTHGASARKWSCIGSGTSVLEDRLSVRLDDGVMTLKAGDFEYVGTRDRDYRSRTGSNAAYEDFGYGGDCTMTAVVETKALDASSSEAALKVRCKGEGFQEDRYRCTAE